MELEHDVQGVLGSSPSHPDLVQVMEKSESLGLAAHLLSAANIVVNPVQGNFPSTEPEEFDQSHFVLIEIVEESSNEWINRARYCFLVWSRSIFIERPRLAPDSDRREEHQLLNMLWESNSIAA